MKGRREPRSSVRYGPYPHAQHLAPERAPLALPPDHRVEHPRLDRLQHLPRQPEQPHVRCAIARRPVAEHLRLLGLRKHVEPEAHVIGVGVAAGRVAVDRELERGLCVEVTEWPFGSMIHP